MESNEVYRLDGAAINLCDRIARAEQGTFLRAADSYTGKARGNSAEEAVTILLSEGVELDEMYVTTHNAPIENISLN